MVDEKIQHQGKKVLLFWNKLFEFYPQYQLDGTWGSIGTLDLMLSPFRGQVELDPAARETLRGANAVIGLLLYQCWASFPGVKTTLFARHDSLDEIVLRAEGGRYLSSGEYFELEISKVIAEILQHSSKTFSVFGKYSRRVFPGDPLLEIFALGAATGCCPLGKGRWGELDSKKMQDYIDAAGHHLAESFADHYRRRFPNEPHGTSAELYFPNLTTPPAGFAEPYLAVQAVARFIDHSQTRGLNRAQMLALAKNFLQCSSELLSFTGFVINTALAENKTELSIRTRALARAKAPMIQQLRPAVGIARELLGQEQDVVSLLELGKVDCAKRLFEIELEAGLVPDFYHCDTTILEEPLHNPLIHFISIGQIEQSLSVLENLEFFFKLTPELQLQRANLALGRQDLEMAQWIYHNHLNDIVFNKSEQEIYRLLFAANLAKARGSLTEHQALLKQSMQIQTTNNELTARLANQLATGFAAQNQLEKAIIAAEQAIELDPAQFQAYQTLAYALTALGRDEQAIEFCRSGLNLVPGDSSLYRYLSNWQILLAIEKRAVNS